MKETPRWTGSSLFVLFWPTTSTKQLNRKFYKITNICFFALSILAQSFVCFIVADCFDTDSDCIFVNFSGGLSASFLICQLFWSDGQFVLETNFFGLVKLELGARLLYERVCPSFTHSETHQQTLFSFALCHNGCSRVI